MGTCLFEASFKKELSVVNPKEAVRAVSLDLWVIHHFRVLPTEERFKRLTKNQKYLLYKGWLELPTSEQIKEYFTKRAGDPVITDDDASNFKKLGYTPEQIRRMKEQLENAGYSQSD